MKQNSKTGIPNLFYIALAIASLAIIAASGPFRPIIKNLIAHENIIYAEFDYDHYFFYSVDGGITWQEVDFEIPEEVSEQIGKYPEIPFILCLPSNKKNICYQTRTETILESQDSGKTWTTSWEFPLGRREFFKRTSSYNQYLGPYDITHIELGGRQIIIAAMGSEGVLVKVDNHEWESSIVDVAGPIYFSAKDFSEVFDVIGGEIYILCILAFILLLINITANTKNINSTWYKGLKISFITTIITLFIIMVLLSSGFYLLFIIGVVIVLFSGLLSVIFTIEQLFNNTNQRAKINIIPLTIAVLTSYFLFICWAFGTIPVYETAKQISTGLYILLLIWILFLPTKEFIQAKMSREKRDLHE